jgi:hypothetical protein
VLPLKDSDVVFPIRSTAQPPLGTRENEPRKKKKKNQIKMVVMGHHQDGHG